MAKPKSIFACAACGTTYPKWLGKCNACGQWGTIEEETIVADVGVRSRGRDLEPERLDEVSSGQEARIDLCDSELNRVLGAGLVRGAFVLLAGEPGIGKSTLVLQTVIRATHLTTLYVSGEESAKQLKLRADRLGTTQSHCLVYTETCIERILDEAARLSPQLLVVDSIQTVYSSQSDSSPASVGQVREVASQLLRFSKSTGIPVILIGHITKEGQVAGPKMLEHMVDVVLQFEGDKQHMYRLLRAAKNRFGSTSEIGIYEMTSGGLRPVENPSEQLINKCSLGLSGTAVACSMEGARSLLIESQALVSSAVYGTPQRSATGFDLRRLNMLLAVLEKRSGFRLMEKDVFLNIAGGLRTVDPAVDLAVISAVLSSSLDIAVPSDICLCGEVGLAGEIRSVSRIRQRISEAERLGFGTMVCPAGNIEAEGGIKTKGIRLVPVNKVEDAFRFLFSSEK
ncbi:MAG: DNA repair protein RadA [Porphyromonas sp.]|nr:DNA repair protein RadA [Porphyromonas sp.]